MSTNETPTQVEIPIIVSRDIKYYFSGGFYNNNPNASLGGEMSSFEITSGALNGVFDRVGTLEAQTGDTEYRCIYLKNTNQTRKLLKTKIWIETTTLSPSTSIALSIGSSGMNGTEPIIPSENIAPPMQFFAVPLTMPEHSNIGDLYPGDSLGLWIRWKIEPNTSSITNDYFVIRLDGEREPEPTFGSEPGGGDGTTDPPPQGCPTGEHWNPVTAECVPISVPIVCPAPLVYSEEEQNCIFPTEPPPDETCPNGFHWDVVSAQCVPDDVAIVCPIGWVYNETTQRCQPQGTNPPPVASFKIGTTGDTTSGADSTYAVVKQNLNTTSTTDPSLFIHVGDVTYDDGNVQPMIDFCETLGTIHPNHVMVSIGNHDDSEDGAGNEDEDLIAAFPMMSPTAYYAITRRNIRFINMNSQADYSVGSNQHTWTMQQLQQADSDPTIKWIFVIVHKPYIGSAGNHAFLTDLRNWLAPASDTYHVDFILNGHNHVYYRTKPVKFNSASPATPIIVANQSTGTYTNVDGRTYLDVASGDQDSGDGFKGSQEAWIAFRDGSPNGGATFFTLQDNGNQMLVEHKTTSNTVDDTAIYTKPGASLPPEITCPSGYHWDETEGRCIASPQQCPSGQHWDENQNMCVPDIIVNPPDTSGNYPVSGIEWYYDSMTTQCLLTNQTISSGNHAPDGVLLSSGASGVNSHTISNGYLNIETGGGNGRCYWDYHTLSRYSQDDQPGFNIAFTCKFKWVNTDNLSIKDGNHGTDGWSLDGQLVFGGFGYSLHKTEVQSKVEYWHNEQGDEVASVYPNNRQLQTNSEYKTFSTLRTDRVGQRVVLNVWMDFGDGSGWVKIMTDRVWNNSNWSPGNVPNGDDQQDVEAGPSHIKRHHIWTRNNVGSSSANLPITELKIGTLPYIS